MTEIKTSLIPNAGRGVFALKPFQKGELIAIYEGDYIGEDEKNRQIQNGNDYIIQFKKGMYINPIAYPNLSHAHIINDPRGTKKRANAKFITCFKGKNKGKIIVRAKKSIHIGEEILVSYGNDYW